MRYHYLAMTAARLLRNARRQARMTQRELAGATGTAQPMIARIERSASVPTFDTLQRLLRGTGTSLEATPRLGQGVDRTLIGQMLALDPEERIASAAAAAAGLSRLLSEVRSARLRR